jgi:hypothetical protein
MGLKDEEEMRCVCTKQKARKKGIQGVTFSAFEGYLVAEGRKGHDRSIEGAQT